MREALQEVFGSDFFWVLFKVILISILSGFIGLERESLSKPAGIRTHILVGISAVLATICGEYVNELSGGDMGRIPSQLLPSIGFIGAGTILRDGFNVKGLTTAASLLAIACIGLCVGTGMYYGAIIATVVVYITLKFVAVPSNGININLYIEVEDGNETFDKVEKLLSKNSINIKNVSIETLKSGKEVIKLVGESNEKINNNEIIGVIMKFDGVKKIVEK